MSINDILYLLPHAPDIWGEGALFAYSGADGPTDSASGMVATYARTPYGLLFHTPRRRLLEITLAGPGTPRLALGDLYAVHTPHGPLVVAWCAWHTLTGLLPPGARLNLHIEDGPAAEPIAGGWLSPDLSAGDALVLLTAGDRFALAYGRSGDEAHTRARAGLAADVQTTARARLAFYEDLPRLADPERSRLLRKCAAVMKVNTLAAEGCFRTAWSTPDRVPHRDMWLWDSAFHALGMSRLRPDLAWDFLCAVLERQAPSGMIPHQMSPGGACSAITQPPVLAWSLWQCHRIAPDRDRLAYALPRLERYLEWDLRHRDANRNGLLEWHIEANERCRSGESGMDNSPRFDRALQLDAVDFSALAAQDMHCLSLIAATLGKRERAAAWQQRAEALSGAIHTHLWDEAAGFYVDRDLEGHLSPVQAVSGFYPLLLADTPPQRIAALARALQDPQRFGAPCPVPSVALCDPAFSTDMWRGATWVNCNHLVIEGLRRHELTDLAGRLRERTLDMVDREYRRYGVLFEFYDAAGRVPPPACDRKGPHQEPYDIRRKMDSIRDYHWTAALTLCLLLEERS